MHNPTKAEAPAIATEAVSPTADPPPFAIDPRAILESMGDAFYALDREWRVVYANRRALAFWNMRADAFVGHILWDALPQLRGTMNESMLRRAAREQRSVSFEALSPVTGSWVQVTVAPYETGVGVYWRDITERKQTEQTLRANEEHLRLAQESAGIGTWDWYLAANSIHWSAQMFRLLGREPVEGTAEQLFALWADALHPDDRDAAYASAHAHSREVKPFTQEFRIVRPDGEVRWILSSGNVLAGDDGAPRRMLGVNIDITDRKRTEEALEQRVQDRTRDLQDALTALQESRTRYGAIFAHAPVDLVFMRVLPDGSLRCEDVNPAWLRHSGYAREQVIGRTLDAIFPPDQAKLFEARFRETIATGQPVEYEYTTQFPVGEAIRRAFQVPLRDADGEVEYVLLTALDLTEMRRIEAQLRQAQKMEAIGQLTGGIAHDFNNLLTAVTGNLELLQRRTQDERGLRYLGTALRAAQRGGALTQQLLAYARQQHLSPRPLDVNAILQGMLDLLQRSLGGLVQVSMELDPLLWPGRADPAQLESMVLNLAINARDAMPQGGTLRIATRNVADAPSGMAPELERGDYVVIAVIDSGSGMPPEVQERAFEPFFTTKAVGKGSGLGLAQVFGLARQFGGTARLQSTLGHGTTVEIFLPRTCFAEPAGAQDGAGEPAQRGSGLVLVVDDDPDVRAVAAGLLAEAGYTVREAGDCAAALAVLEREPVAVALVDYAMPGNSGLELVRLARQRRPGLKVVYVSGADLVLEPERDGADLLLAKPYTAAALLQVVREALRGRGRDASPQRADRPHRSA